MVLSKLTNLFTRFPKVYWVVLSFELLERGAYYSMMPILAVHFMYNVGLPQALCLMLTVFMYPFQYAMPILTSALAEKVGYRKQMIFGFSFLFFAYIFLSFAFNIGTAIFAVMAVGFGIGCYKPLVSSTIAKSTEQRDRNVAYSVYYWIVNFAAAMFALLWGILMLAGIIPQTAFAWIFRVSALYFAVNVLVAVFIFREVPRSGQVKTFRDVGSNIATAFKDKKFVVMMLLIAGFWALYSTTLAPFIIIMYGYRFLPMWIPVILLGVINPGVIIALGGPLSKFAEKIESIKLLMGGVFIYLIGLSLITFFLEVLPLVIVGMVIYSIGEFMVAPGYLAFVSKLAPKEKVSAYIGCNFLASFTGIFGGALFFGLICSIVGVDWRRPHFFYGLLMGFGMLILVGFMIYYKYWGQDIINRAKAIEAMERGEEEEGVVLDVPVVHKEPVVFKIFEFKVTAIIAILLVPVILASTYAVFGTDVFYPPEADDDDGKDKWNLDDYEVLSIAAEDLGTQYAEENSEVPMDYSPGLNDGELLKSITVTVTWTDEDDIRRLIRTFENEPDNFAVELRWSGAQGEEGSADITQASQSAANTHGSPGTVSLKLDNIGHSSADSLNGTGTWEIIVKCGDCGDLRASGPALTYYEDTGNDFSVSVEAEVYALPEE